MAKRRMSGKWTVRNFLIWYSIIVQKGKRNSGRPVCGVLEAVKRLASSSTPAYDVLTLCGWGAFTR